MKRIVTIVCVVALLICMTSVYAGSAGSSSDPLISLSYVQDTYIPTMVNACKADVNEVLNQVYTAAEAKTRTEKLGAFYDSTLTLSAGSCFVLLTGSATVSVSGTLINVSNGSEVRSGATVSVGQRYIVCEESSATIALVAGSTCTVSGVYSFDDNMCSMSFTPISTPAPGRTVLTQQKIIFNGTSLDMEVYNVDGDNYFKLRDIAYLLRNTSYACSVDFSTPLRTVLVVSGGDYTPNGDEMLTGVDYASSCRSSQWWLVVDGTYRSCSVYNIGGNNFFRLRDLGNVLGFDVDYDAATNSAVITA
jgi:hypothetical protein